MIVRSKVSAMVGKANGNWTFISFCILVAPAMSAASVISGGTVRNPSIA